MRQVVKHMRPRKGERIAHVEHYLEPGDPQYEKFLVDERDAEGVVTGKKIPGCVYGVDVRMTSDIKLQGSKDMITALFADIKKQMARIKEAEEDGMFEGDFYQEAL